MSDFRLGEHEQAIKTLLAGQAEMQRDIAAIREILAERRGERRVGLWVAGVVGSAVSLAVTVAIKLIGQYVKIGT